jgi:hypothetical protein
LGVNVRVTAAAYFRCEAARLSPYGDTCWRDMLKNEDKEIDIAAVLHTARRLGVGRDVK